MNNYTILQVELGEGPIANSRCWKVREAYEKMDLETILSKN